MILVSFTNTRSNADEYPVPYSVSTCIAANLCAALVAIIRKIFFDVHSVGGSAMSLGDHACINLKIMHKKT